MATVMETIKTKIEEARSLLEDLLAEAQEKLDSMSEKARESERGEKLDAKRDALEEVDSHLEDALLALPED